MPTAAPATNHKTWPVRRRGPLPLRLLPAEDWWIAETFRGVGSSRQPRWDVR